MMIAIILFFIALDNPLRAAIGVAVVMLGIPVYWFLPRLGKLPSQ
jgi:hypothetical protein